MLKKKSVMKTYTYDRIMMLCMFSDQIVLNYLPVILFLDWITCQQFSDHQLLFYPESWQKKS